METATVKEMFRALFRNDQALTMVVAIVMINTALYITSNLVIYFSNMISVRKHGRAIIRFLIPLAVHSRFLR